MERTILKEILRNCREKGDLPVYNWIKDNCDVERVVTYRQLGERTREIAEDLLLSQKLRRGERVVLCYPPGLDFILALVACLRAGITAGCAFDAFPYFTFHLLLAMHSNQWPW